MTVNDIIALLLQSVLVPLLIYGIALLRNYVMARIQNTQALQAIDMASDAAAKAVAQTAQCFVDEIKGTKDWDAAAMQQAFASSVLTAKEILGTEGLLLLQKVTGDVNTYLSAAIEEAVRNSKHP